MSYPMLYTEFHPRLELKPWVATHWHFRVEPGVPEIDHWVPPNGGVMLSVMPNVEPMLIGPRTEPLLTRVWGGIKVWGTMLWPGTALSLLEIDVEMLRCNLVPARTVLGDEAARTLVDRLAQLDDEAEAAAICDAILLDRLPPSQALDEMVMRSVFCILESNGETPIEEVAATVNLSPRQLRRRFRSQVGLTPKELARIQRLRTSAVDAVTEAKEPWIAIAANRGYADQAHLIREFRSLLGVTPTGFEKHFRRIDHPNLVR